MPVLSDIDKNNRVIIRRVIGELTIKDVLGALDSTTRLTGYKSGMGPYGTTATGPLKGSALSICKNWW
jgi:hypothetical protein